MTAWRVAISQAEANRLRAWGPHARRLGLTDAFVGNLKILNWRLQSEPTDDWSEEYLTSADLEYRLGAHDFLAVAYAVHAADRCVFVKRFHWLGPHEQRPAEE